MSAVGFAALVAPAVDRVFVDGMAEARRRGGGDVVRRHGPGAGPVLIEFRTALAWPGRRVAPEEFAAVTRYRDAAEFERILAEQAELGLIVRDADGGFRASERGHALLADVWAHQGEVLPRLWPDAARVDRLNDVLARVLEAAESTGGPAWRAMAPPYEPKSAAPAVLLLNRLGTLRYHRADAHAAAWAAVGLTAASVRALPAGPARDAIEADTNARAAPPYAVLTTDEQIYLLADLAALPGQRRD